MCFLLGQPGPWGPARPRTIAFDPVVTATTVERQVVRATRVSNPLPGHQAAATKPILPNPFTSHPDSGRICHQFALALLDFAAKETWIPFK